MGARGGGVEPFVKNFGAPQNFALILIFKAYVYITLTQLNLLFSALLLTLL